MKFEVMDGVVDPENIEDMGEYVPKEVMLALVDKAEKDTDEKIWNYLNEGLNDEYLEKVKEEAKGEVNNELYELYNLQPYVPFPGDPFLVERSLSQQDIMRAISLYTEIFGRIKLVNSTKLEDFLVLNPSKVHLEIKKYKMPSIEDIMKEEFNPYVLGSGHRLFLYRKPNFYSLKDETIPDEVPVYKNGEYQGKFVIN